MPRQRAASAKETTIMEPLLSCGDGTRTRARRTNSQEFSQENSAEDSQEQSRDQKAGSPHRLSQLWHGGDGNSRPNTDASAERSTSGRSAAPRWEQGRAGGK